METYYLLFLFLEGWGMGRYLNSQTREDSVVICGMIDAFKDITDR